MGTLQIVLIGMLGDAMAARLGRLSPRAVSGIQSKDVYSPGSEPEVEESMMHTSEDA
jgi:hypothetical protein